MRGNKIGALLLIATAPLYARGKAQGYCEQGGQVVVTSAVQSTTKVMQSYPQCSITVYYTGGPVGVVSTSGTSVTWTSGTLFNANSGWAGLTITINSVTYTISSVASSQSLTLTSSAGTQTNVTYSMGSTTPAAIFTSNGTAQANPFAASSTGLWGFYADNGDYDIRASGGGIPAPFTWGGVSVLDGNSLPTTISDVGYFYRGQTIGTACSDAKSLGAQLSISMYWRGLTTQTLDCDKQFVGGILQVGASPNVLTISGNIQAGQYRVFDISLGGTIVAGNTAAIANPVNAAWWSVPDGSTDNTAGVQAAWHFIKADGTGSGAPRTGEILMVGAYVISDTIKWNNFAGVLNCKGSGEQTATPKGSTIKWKTGASSGIPMFQYDNSRGFSVNGCKTLGNAANPPSAHYNCKSGAFGGGAASQQIRFTDVYIEDSSSSAGSATNGWLADGANANCDSHTIINANVSHVVNAINLTRTQNVNWQAINFNCVNNTGSCGKVAGELLVVGGSLANNGNVATGAGAEWVFQKDSSGTASNAIIQLDGTVSDGSTKWFSDEGVSIGSPTFISTGGSYNVETSRGIPNNGSCGPTSNTTLYANCSYFVDLSATAAFVVKISGTKISTSTTLKPMFNFGGAVTGNKREVSISGISGTCPSWDYSNFLLMTAITGTALSDITQSYSLNVCGGPSMTQNGPYGANAVVQPVPGQFQIGSVVYLNKAITTFTPILKFGGGTTGITYADQLGEYTNVGGIVNARVSVVLTNKGSSTGAATICGFPTAGNNQNSRWGGSVAYLNNMSTISTPIISLDTGGNCVNLYNVGTGSIGNITDTNFANNSNFQFTIQYHQ